jgi:ubiquitin C-terminal hydrolase
MKGIPNIGNTCFINSIIQSLNNIDDLRCYILSNNYNTSLYDYYNINKIDLPQNYESCKELLLNLQKLFIALNSDEYDISKYMRLFCINLKQLASDGDHVALGISDFSIHNDAEEFLSFILDKIEDFSIDNKFKNMKNSTAITNLKKQYINKNIIINSFKIQEITQYKCMSCNNLTKLNYNNYLNKIQLSINERFITSLDTALAYYTLTNEMSDYKCDKCKMSGIAKTRTLLSVLPKYIIIQLLRFKNDGTKINKSIDLPLHINLDKYSYRDKGLNYELQSVSCHLDMSTSFGHYISITRNNDKWYIQDDESIKEINESQASEYIKRKGYIYIFKKI